MLDAAILSIKTYFIQYPDISDFSFLSFRPHFLSGWLIGIETLNYITDL